MKTLIIGLGNPVLGDDGIGWHIAGSVKARLDALGREDSIEIEFLSLGGLSLMEHMIGYDRVILIDAIHTVSGKEGQVYKLDLKDLPALTTSHLSSTHDTSLQNALRVGRSLGASLPEQIQIIAIEARNTYEFSEHLSQPVAAAVDQAVQMVFSILDERS